MEREHVMVLLDADMTKVHARLAKKFNAGMAESERIPRKDEYTGESPVTGSSLYERGESE